MRVRILVGVVGLLLVAVPVTAQDVSQGSRCSPDTFHRYSLTTPSSVTTTGWPDFQATLYYNNYAATFLLVLFDDDSDVVASSSGYTRFAQIRVGLLPSKRYELWVGCITASADFRLLATFGDVKSITGHGTVASAVGPSRFDAGEQLAFLDREAEMVERLAEMAATPVNTGNPR